MIDFKEKMEEEQKKNDPNYDPVLAKLLATSKKRRRIRSYLTALVIIGIIFTGKIIMSSQNSNHWFGDDSWFGKIKHLTGVADNKLEGEENDRINILLLGIGGQNHDGGNLTDTIILASLKPSSGQASLISLPRDLTIPMGSAGWRKINSINALAEAKEKGSGGQATTKALSDLLETPINYYVRVDFAGFMEIIDEMGGIEVNVENDLNDYQYPIMGQEDNPDYYARFEHLYIPAGLQKMDGELALKYARSRHGLGLEGSDFARSRRQQLILEAVKSKLLSRDNLLKPVMMAKIINKLENNISTNLEIWEMVRLWDLTKNISRDQVINEVIDHSPNSFLIDSRGEDGAYILVPKTGNFQKIRQFVQNIFNSTDTAINGTTLGLNNAVKNGNTQITKSSGESKVEILNGTWIGGMAGQEAGFLKEYNFTITGVGNAQERNYVKSVIYDLSYGRQDKDLKLLQTLTSASLAFDPPDWLNEYKAPANKKQGEQSATSTPDQNKEEDVNGKEKEAEEEMLDENIYPDFVLVLGTEAQK